MLPREQGKNAQLAQQKLKEIRESRDIPEEQKGFVVEEYMKNNHPQQWNMIQAGVQARQQSQQGGGQPPGLLAGPNNMFNDLNQAPDQSSQQSSVNRGTPQGPNAMFNNMGGGPVDPHRGMNTKQFSEWFDKPIMSGDTSISPQGSIPEANFVKPYQPGLESQAMNQPNPNVNQDVVMTPDQGAMEDYFARTKEIAYNDGLTDGRVVGNDQNQNPVGKPVEQPGIFSRIGSGLQSAGQGMGNYAEKLFNDPNRMAMLQGGLSMMNPNSYYDKQGFGSVFQGLQAGLGQAQSGMKGVMDRRKAVSDRALVDAKSGLAAAGGKPSPTMEGYNKAKDQGFPGTYLEYRKQIGEYGKPVTNLNMTDSAVGHANKQAVADFYKKHLPEARSSKKSLMTTEQGRLMIEKGILTGGGVEPIIWLSNLASKMGMDFPGKTDVDRTRSFISWMGSGVAETITDFGAGTGLSDADRIFAQGMVGQDPSEFSEESLKKLFMLNEMKERWNLEQFNERGKAMLEFDKGGNLMDKASMHQKIPPMSTALRDHIIENKRSGALDNQIDPETGKIPMPTGWKGGQANWDNIQVGSSGFKIKNVRPKQ